MTNIQKNWDKILEVHDKTDWSLDCCIRAFIDGDFEQCDENCEECWKKILQWITEEVKDD